MAITVIPAPTELPLRALFLSSSLFVVGALVRGQLWVQCMLEGSNIPVDAYDEGERNK
jgi:hypothetical protein